MQKEEVKRYLAAAKLLQSCPTLWDPIDGSPPGSPVPGILQARTLEWVAISFSNAWKWKVKSESEVARSCPTLRDPMDCSLPGSSIHGIFQARVLEWGAIAFSEEIPGVIGNFGLGVKNEAGQKLTVLPREHIGDSKHPFPTTQEMTLHMDISKWSISKSDWLYSLQLKMVKLYAVSKHKTGSWLWLRSWTPYC